MQIKRILVFFLMILIITPPVFCKEKPTSFTNEDQQKKEQNPSDTPFLKAMWQDQADIWSSPFKMKTKDLWKWFGAALITGVLIANDEGIYRNFKDFQGRNPWVDDFSPAITVLGDGTLNLGICGIFYLSGLLFKDGKAKETAKLSLMSLLHASIVVQVIKHLSGRQRPSVDNGKDYWHGPSGIHKRYTEDGFSP